MDDYICEKCGERICICGWEWATWKPSQLKKLSGLLLMVRDLKTSRPELSPDGVYSWMKKFYHPNVEETEE